MAFLDEPYSPPRWKRATLFAVGTIAVLTLPLAALHTLAAGFGQAASHDGSLGRQIEFWLLLLSPLIPLASAILAFGAYRSRGRTLFVWALALLGIWWVAALAAGAVPPL